VVTAFELADSSGTFNLAVGTDESGRLIFQRQAAAGFIVFVEGRPGATRLPVGSVTYTAKPNDPRAQPDLQLVSSHPLGDGSTAVCDNSLPGLGGIPATEPADFSPQQATTDALNDFGCRFRVFDEADLACTQDSGGNFLFRSSSSTIQFCTLVSNALTFPPGDTVLTARLRDTSGNAGPTFQMVVRIPEG
jgi:hypothetical protein